MENNRRSQMGNASKQEAIVYDYLMTHTATASMIEEATGIHHKNICRIKRHLEKAGKLWQVKKISCPITGHTAWALTTNPKSAGLNSLQLKLF